MWKDPLTRVLKPDDEAFVLSAKRICCSFFLLDTYTFCWYWKVLHLVTSSNETDEPVTSAANHQRDDNEESPQPAGEFLSLDVCTFRCDCRSFYHLFSTAFFAHNVKISIRLFTWTVTGFVHTQARTRSKTTSPTDSLGHLELHNILSKKFMSVQNCKWYT